MNDLPPITVPELLERYACILLDAYGVLITHDHPLPGAGAFIAHLNAVGKPYFILTNDGSRLPETAARRYREFGIAVDAGRVITSGLTLAPYFEEHGLRGAQTGVLGPPDSLEYVRRAGGVPVPLANGAEAEVVVVCDEGGYDLLPGVDAALSLVHRRLEAGLPTPLILANPDLIYPAGPGRFGITGGAVAFLIENALRALHPGREDLRFVPLGKPHAPMFREAEHRAGTRDLVMVGDQISTDIRGASRFGIASALVLTGVTRFDGRVLGGEDRPTWVLRALEPEGANKV